MNNTETAVLRTEGLCLATGKEVPDVEIPRGLTLLRVPREGSATVLSMTLSGRMAPKKGTVRLLAGGREWNTSKQLFQRCAVAGVPAIDTLERLVPARAVIREQIAWTSPWYKLTPRSIDHHEPYVHAAELLGLELDDAAARIAVGELPVLDRLKLRTVLALIARPEREAVFVDDVDQLRDLELRDEFLRSLRGLAAEVPVIVTSANPDQHGLVDQTVDLKATDFMTGGE